MALHQKEKFVRGDVHQRINPFGNGWKNVHGEIGVAECGDSTFRAPAWSSKAEYSAELSSISKDSLTKIIKLDKHSCYLAGKNPELCNIHLDHPSISRQHAAFIHSKLGVTYLVDLNSSHGTFNGKNKINPKMLFELRSGSIIKFAGSSRTYIFRAYLNQEQINGRFQEQTFVETPEGDPCSLELCKNTSLNARVSYSSDQASVDANEPSKKRARVENKHVTFSENEPVFIPFVEVEEDTGLVTKVGVNEPVVGKFASLISTETVVSVRKPMRGAPGVKRPPVVSAAERRRRQALLMDHTRSTMQPVVRPAAPVERKIEKRRAPTPVVEEVEDEDGPMDLRKA